MSHGAGIMCSWKTGEAEMLSDQQLGRPPHDHLYHCPHGSCQLSKGFAFKYMLR